MFLIMKDYTSAYEIWNYIGQHPTLEIRPMAYFNTNKRILRLYKNGFLEVIKRSDKSDKHGRRDYKITPKGMNQLIPYVFLHPEETETIINYLHKFPIETDQIVHWQNIIHKFYQELVDVKVAYSTPKSCGEITDDDEARIERSKLAKMRQSSKSKSKI